MNAFREEKKKKEFLSKMKYTRRKLIQQRKLKFKNNKSEAADNQHNKQKKGLKNRLSVN